MPNDKVDFINEEPKLSVKKAKLVKPNNELKQKVGAGGFRNEDIMRAQSAIDNNKVDFTPEAELLLKTLQQTISDIKKQKIKNEDALDTVVYPILQLRAQGAMFSFPVFTKLGKDILLFLEDVGTVDDHVLEILSSFHQVAKILLDMKITDETNPTAQKLDTELKLVYTRYLKNKKDTGA